MTEGDKICIHVCFPVNVPGSEFSDAFVQGMADRMSMSFFKYGAVAVAYPNKVDALASLKLRVNKYLETGNTELLMDVANFAMIEFMHPRLEHAHFSPRDGGPGRVWFGEVDPSQRSNEGED